MEWTNEMNARLKWHMERQKYIGASDVAAVNDIGYRSTPLDVYLYKTASVEQMKKRVEEEFTQEDKPSAFGQKMEDTIIKSSCMRNKVSITERNKRFKNTTYPIVSSEVDGVFENHNGKMSIIEAKTINEQYNRYLSEKGLDLPVEYWYQVQAQLASTGLSVAVIAKMVVNSENFYRYVIDPDSIEIEHITIEFDEKTFKIIYSVVERFWHENVLKGIPPEPSERFMREDTEKLYPRNIKDSFVANADFVRECSYHNSLNLQKKDIEEQIRLSKGKIAAGMGAYSVALDDLDRVRATYRVNKNGSRVLNIKNMKDD